MNEKLLREWIRSALCESEASDAFEQSVASAISEAGRGTFTASAAGGDVRLADVYVDVPGIGDTYVEAKMGHRDNLANPRIYFDGSSWATKATSPVAIEAVRLANTLDSATTFITDLKNFMGIPQEAIIKIPTTKGGLKDIAAVPLEVMRDFVDNRGTRYFVNEENVDIGDLVTQHYLTGKNEPAHYIQAGDDFYRIGTSDPLNLKQALKFCKKDNNIPVLAGTGNFKIRVSTRSAFYEIQPELKIAKFVPASSIFSVFPSDDKINPFECLYELMKSQTVNSRKDETLDILAVLIQETLLVEELTKSDKKEIKKLARKEAEAEIKKSLGKSFFGTPGKINKAIQDIAREELQTALKGKELEKAASQVTKKVLHAFYKMMYDRKNLIDNIKV